MQTNFLNSMKDVSRLSLGGRGIGQVWGSVRDPLPDERSAQMLTKIGPGESSYNNYDRLIADEACNWLKSAANQTEEKPWVLYLGFVAPHFPLVVPEEFYNLYRKPVLQVLALFLYMLPIILFLQGAFDL